jgi:hypothetical protein
MDKHHDCKCNRCKKFKHHDDNCKCDRCNKFHHHHDNCHCNDCRKFHHHHHNDCHCDDCRKFDHHHHNDCHCDDCKRFHSHHHFLDDRFICDDRFRFRLGGLTTGIAFRLRQLIDCKVRIIVDGEKKIIGKILFVGTDFIEVFADHDPDKKHRKDCDCKKALILPFDAIKFFEQLD